MNTPDQQLTENKLTILYILQQKDTVSSIELSDFIVFKGYMDYFTMQELIEELLYAELILDMDGSYTLTPMGDEVVTTFRYRIPNSIRDEINEYARTSAYRRSSMLEADCEINKTEQGYDLNCIIRDYDHVVFSLSIHAPDEEKAYAVRNRWQQRGLTIFRNLISELRQ